MSALKSSCLVVLGILGAAHYLVRVAAGEDVPVDSYGSYLQWPRVHFSGLYRADVSTVNNVPTNFNTGNIPKLVPTWNPMGSAQWTVEGKVTRVCLRNGDCEDRSYGELQGIEPGTSAKLVDLDSQAQYFSEIWGWRLKVGKMFAGDFTPVPFQKMWRKMKAGSSDSHALGAIYTSVLSNIEWINETEPIVKDLRASNPAKLSIHFNVDLFSSESKWSNLSWGRIVGAIGVAGERAPPFSVGQGRMMWSLDETVQDTPFLVDSNAQRVFVDFGNSLPITPDGSMNTSLLGTLVVGIDTSDQPTFTCSDQMSWIGVVFNTLRPNWYQVTSGIQAFPTIGTLSKNQTQHIRDHPVVVIEVEDTSTKQQCKRVLLAEERDGIFIHPASKWTLRTEAKRDAKFEFLVTKFGQPAPNEVIEFKECLNVFYRTPGLPLLGIPKLNLPSPINTNEDGVARVTIATLDPRTSRGYLDGQLYGFCYGVKGSRAPDINSQDNVIAVRLYDAYPDVTSPTWLEHIYPIFKQYAELYPVMTKNFVDLGNYFDVKAKKQRIIDTMSLAPNHTNYMPVTRDLSEAKKRVILKWLATNDLPVGEWNKTYSLKQLKADLQTALQIEHATIPPYLTAFATVKNAYNSEVLSVFKTVLVQEMLHMSLVSNILNAIGGEPKLYYDGFIPQYPSHLPGGVQPGLVVPIEKCSLSLIRNVFMKIEQPMELEEDSVSDIVDQSDLPPVPQLHTHCPSFDHSCYVFMSKHGLGTPKIGWHEKYQKTGNLKGIVPPFVHPSNSIGAFYSHIRSELKYLDGIGSIFTGNDFRQVEWKNLGGDYALGDLIKVTDLHSALKAIDEIVKEGEGSSASNPYNFYKHKAQLSHYYLFKCLAEKHQLRAYKEDNDDMIQNRPFTIDYLGPKIPFDEEGIWPMVRNPKMSMFRTGSKAHIQAQLFNKVYTKLLKTLELTFNGKPTEIKNALGLMFAVQLHLKNLVRTPIDDVNGIPDMGPNAGPTFIFTPE